MLEGSQAEARLFLLGAPRGHIAGQDIQITHRKPLALLAYLAVTQRPHTREALASLFWPDSDTARAYAYLRNALWQLGQTAFGVWLSIDQDRIELSPDVDVDRVHMRTLLTAVRSHTHPQQNLCADCSQKLDQVVNLYRGDFLEGFTLEDCPEFDTWQFFEADTVKQDVGNALQVLTEHATHQGDTRAALGYARRWVELDSLNEPAQRALMLLYAQDGQRAAALRQYDSLLKELRASGLQPSAETIALYKQIRSGEIETVGRSVRQDLVGASPVQEAEGAPTSRRRAHNLPVEATTFIGRTAELGELHELLVREECRLITLTGTGGIGKTRLALKCGHEALNAFADGVFLVSFVAIQTPDLILSTIADALGVSFYPQAAVTPQEQLITYLSDKAVLLILDNVEHLLQSSATIADVNFDISTLLGEILSRTGAVKMLVTSRERLNLRGEWVMEVRGLAYPEPLAGAEAAARADESADAEASGDEERDRGDIFDAARLFIETARRVTTGFEPTSSDLEAIARICRLVEGMPLGLELAAAWTKMLPCTEIADEVATSLDFLTLTLRDLPERHQSLRAVFARSWGLLSSEERRLFRALAIFRGGFTREAALEVVAARLPTLSALMDKSLLHRTSDNRYEILEVLRQYAAEQLGAMPGEAVEIQRRHAGYYLRLVAESEAALKGDLHTQSPVGQKEALERIRRDIGNIRSAWQWSLEHGAFDEIERALIGLALYHDIRSRFRQGERLCREAVAALEMGAIEMLAGDTNTRRLALLLGIQGEFLCRVNEVDRGCALMDRAYSLLGTSPDDTDLDPAHLAARALLQVLSSYVGIGLSNEERARRLQESVKTYQALGDLWGEALSLEVLGELVSSSGDLDAAEPLLRDSLRLRRHIGDEWGAAMSLHTLGLNAKSRGESAEARACLEESLALRKGLGDIRGATLCQSILGRWLASMGDLELAASLRMKSLHGFEAIGDLSSVADTLMALGHISHATGDAAQAQAYYLSALEKRRRLGRLADVAGTLHSLGDLAADMQEYGRARAYLEESLSILTGISAAERTPGTSSHGLSSEAFTGRVRQSLTALAARQAT
jgi:predicted ATPase/DNA-binding SARP family transcriptional activator